MLNIVALMGRLTHTPELKTTQNGTSVCSFSIAVDRTYTPKGEERKADFIDIVAWRQTAEFICKYFQKGSMIAVDGSIQRQLLRPKGGRQARCARFRPVDGKLHFRSKSLLQRPAGGTELLAGFRG